MLDLAQHVDYRARTARFLPQPGRGNTNRVILDELDREKACTRCPRERLQGQAPGNQACTAAISTAANPACRHCRLPSLRSSMAMDAPTRRTFLNARKKVPPLLNAGFPKTSRMKHIACCCSRSATRNSLRTCTLHSGLRSRLRNTPANWTWIPPNPLVARLRFGQPSAYVPRYFGRRKAIYCLSPADRMFIVFWTSKGCRE